MTAIQYPMFTLPIPPANPSMWGEPLHPVPPPPPLLIEGLLITPTADGATVAFTTTNDALSTVHYGPDTSYGGSISAGDTTLHNATITGLAPGTYHLLVVVNDEFGQSANSGDQTFEVPAP